MGRPKSDFDALREDLRKVYDGDPYHEGQISLLKRAAETANK
jgi:hypothetical protein